MTVQRPCVLYARKSTDREDKQILSIPAQLRELREFAARAGLTITAELTESCSARKPGRPVFTKLLQNAGAGRVDRILSWRLDRCARNPVDGGQLIYLLGENKLKELITPEGTYTGAGDSKFMLSVLFGAATKMTDDLAAGVRRGNREVWKRGQIPGRPPIGYLKSREGVGPKQTGRVVPDPERFAIVQRIWKEMATGSRTVSWVWRQAVHDWGLRATKTGQPPTLGALYGVLRNPFYTGLIATPDGLLPGEHEPVVTRNDFERVQRLIRRQGTARPSRHDFLYRCVLLCGRCGRHLVGERIVKKSGLTFTYYRCGRRRQDRERCHAPAVPEGAVTNAIESNLARLVLPANTAKWLRDAVKQWAAEQSGHVAGRVSALKASLERAEAELHRLTDLVVRAVLTEEDFVARRDATQARIRELHAALTEPEAELRAWHAGLTQALDEGLTLLDAFREGTNDERRALLARVYANPVVSEGIIEPAFRFPFTLLADASDLSTVAASTDSNPVDVIDSLLNQTKNAHP